MKRILFALCTLITFAGSLSAMEPAMSTDWYTYAVKKGLTNPIKLQISNNTNDLILVMYKKGAPDQGNYGYDMVDQTKTFTIIYGIPNATIPFAQLIIRTATNDIYLLDFVPRTDGGFIAFLSKSDASSVTDKNTSILELAQLTITMNKQILANQTVHTGNTVTITVSNTGVQLVVIP